MYKDELRKINEINLPADFVWRSCYEEIPSIIKIKAKEPDPVKAVKILRDTKDWNIHEPYIPLLV